MRVMIVTGSFPPMRCGVGDYSHALANSLAARGSEVCVLTSLSGAGTEEINGPEIFPIMSQWGLTEAIKVIKLIRHWSPDIVHIQYPTLGYGEGLLPWLIPMLAFAMQGKVVQTWHEGYPRRSAFWLALKSTVPSRLVFVRPSYVERHLHSMLKWAICGKKPVYIPNASSIPRVSLSAAEASDIRKRYLQGQKRLIAFFGFVYPAKGVELLFEIADPATDQIVIAGEITEENNYAQDIMRHASVGVWKGRVIITGFLPPNHIASLLAVADAVILPFRGGGGGSWNTTIHAAVANGAFVLTTSTASNGYSKHDNTYYAKVDDIKEMREALGAYAGIRRAGHANDGQDEWRKIADEHHSLYESLLPQRPRVEV